MSGDLCGVDISIGTTGLARLMPMHLLLTAQGRIVGAGPTMSRIFAGQPLIGARFEDAFEVRSPGGAKTVEDVLDRGGHRFRLAARHRPRVGLRGLGVRLPAGDLILLNLCFGIDLIAAVREFGLTDADFAATDLAMELLYLAEANTAVTRELRGLNLRLEDARLAAEEEALTDPLTGLRNRRAVDLFLDRMTAAGASFGLLHLDLDFFKAVNDSRGHAAGDFVLENVGRILREQVRTEDCAARIGGDEFLIVLQGCTDANVLGAVARRIIARIAEPMEYEGQPCRISASVGLVRSVDFQPADTIQMLVMADRALYAAKHAGRSRAVLLGPDGTSTG